MGWNHRGNGFTHESLNGYCAFIGLNTEKVFDFLPEILNVGSAMSLIPKVKLHKNTIAD